MANTHLLGFFRFVNGSISIFICFLLLFLRFIHDSIVMSSWVSSLLVLVLDKMDNKQGKDKTRVFHSA